MTARDRALLRWMRDFFLDQLGAVDHRPTIRRLEASVRMINRMLAKDAKAKVQP